VDMKRRMRDAMLLACMLCVVVLLPSCSRKREAMQGRCPFCSMPVRLPEDFQGAKMVFEDGSAEFYCCMAHAMKGWLLELVSPRDPKNPPVTLMVVEYPTRRMIDAGLVTYVVGSDVSPHMSMFRDSVIAFESGIEAHKFAKKHGGRVRSFDELKKENLFVMKK
jgi:nitrous oxide reductase accessory protein NosL